MNNNLYPFPIFNKLNFLTEKEYQQVELIFDLIYPSDHVNGIPGSIDAKAVDFVTQLLSFDDKVYYKISNWRLQYREGLKELEVYSLSEYKKPLLSLVKSEILSILKKLEKDEITNWSPTFKQSTLLELFIDHCIQGCFSDPRWGGNKNEIMWTWLGWVKPPQDINFK